MVISIKIFTETSWCNDDMLRTSGIGIQADRRDQAGQRGGDLCEEDADLSGPGLHSRRIRAWIVLGRYRTAAFLPYYQGYQDVDPRNIRGPSAAVGTGAWCPQAKSRKPSDYKPSRPISQGRRPASCRDGRQGSALHRHASTSSPEAVR